MCVVRLVDDIGDRQLQLMRPQPPGFVARREAESPPEVKQDVRGLRDEHVTVFEERRGERQVRVPDSVHQPLHRWHAAAPARDIVIFGASLLQGETYEFTAALDTRPI